MVGVKGVCVIGKGGVTYLHIKSVELDWVIPVHILVREEKFLSQSSCLLGSLLLH